MGGHPHCLDYLHVNPEPPKEFPSMNRLLARVLLLLIIVALLFSMYSFAQGRLMEGLFIYPLLITIYVVMKLGGKGGE